MINRGSCRLAAVAGGLLSFSCLIALLLWAGGAPALPRLDVDLGSAVADAAALASWACLAWIAVAVAVSVVAQIPGAVGRAASAVSSRITPVLFRRLVQAAFGVTVATSPVLAPLGVPVAAASTVHPVSVTEGTPLLSPLSTPLSSLPSLDRPPGLELPVVEAPVVETPAVGTPAVDLDARDAYVVQRGDTLWGIAARHLPAPASASEVARTWPQWYLVNRDVIGDDPNLILPGQLLQVPTLEVTR